MEFNPLTNVKSVKDYEQEIQRLRSENFELKTHLTHVSAHPANDNLPKLLYEQNEKFAQLDREKQEMARQLDEMRGLVAQLNQEKMLLSNKYNQEAFANGEKMGLLEDENKRLILRMEKINKENSEAQKAKGLQEEAVRVNAEYKNYIHNIEKQYEQMKFENAQQLKELEATAEELRQQAQKDAEDRKFEVDGLKRALESEGNKNKSNALIIDDLKSTLSNEIRERARLQKEHVQTREDAKKEGHERIIALQTYIDKVHREGEGYLAGMEKFKSIIGGKLNALGTEAGKLSARLEGIAKCNLISDENKKFIDKLKIREITVNGIVNGLRKIVVELHRRMEVLKKEANDATFFAESSKKGIDSKTGRLLEEFCKQFNEAKTELVACKRYLEKKAEENKTLKNENARLQKELGARPISLGFAGYGGALGKCAIKNNMK